MTISSGENLPQGLLPPGINATHWLGVNWERLLSIGDRDWHFTANLLQVFYQDAQRQEPLMQRAIAQADWQQLQQLAHRLKGGCANVGLPALQDWAAQLESAAAAAADADFSLSSGLQPLLSQMQERLRELLLAHDHCLIWAEAELRGPSTVARPFNV
jgi:HPt (histidine-containing phosphotransfer) domain-containing protein